MKSETKVRQMLENKVMIRNRLNKNKGKAGNKGYKLSYLAVECDLLKDILKG